MASNALQEPVITQLDYRQGGSASGRRRGGQPGNRNAVGNRGGVGPPPGNENALTTLDRWRPELRLMYRPEEIRDVDEVWILREAIACYESRLHYLSRRLTRARAHEDAHAGGYKGRRAQELTAWLAGAIVLLHQCIEAANGRLTAMQ